MGIALEIRGLPGAYEDVVLSQESGNYGVNIPKGVWHKLESLEAGSVVFECKEGPFVPHEVDGILDIGRL